MSLACVYPQELHEHSSGQTHAHSQRDHPAAVSLQAGRKRTAALCGLIGPLAPSARLGLPVCRRQIASTSGLSFRTNQPIRYALDRLSRYEASLWRQAGQILFALDALDRRKPQERGRRSLSANSKDCRSTSAKSVDLSYCFQPNRSKLRQATLLPLGPPLICGRRTA